MKGDVSFLRKQESRFIPAKVGTWLLRTSFLDSRFRGNDTLGPASLEPSSPSAVERLALGERSWVRGVTAAKLGIQKKENAMLPGFRLQETSPGAGPKKPGLLLMQE